MLADILSSGASIKGLDTVTSTRSVQELFKYRRVFGHKKIPLNCKGTHVGGPKTRPVSTEPVKMKEQIIPLPNFFHLAKSQSPHWVWLDKMASLIRRLPVLRNLSAPLSYPKTEEVMARKSIERSRRGQHHERRSCEDLSL